MELEKHEKYMKMAIELAKEGVFPFGTIVVKDDQIIGQACSTDTANDPTAHADTVAVRRACEALGTNDLSGATIYCTCEPCLMCFGTIWWANIRNIVYATSIKETLNQDICSFMEKLNIGAKELSKLTSNDFNIVSGICGDEVLSLMKEWQIKQDSQGVSVNKHILVVGTAFIRKGKLLVSMSQRSAKSGKYTLVGGGVDAGETFKEAARRECQEEIASGFDIKEEELKEILCFREPALSNPHLNIEMHMMVALKDVDVPLVPNEEIREFRWFSLGEDESVLSTAVKDHFIPWAKENKIMY